jgi:hypothetical protein
MLARTICLAVAILALAGRAPAVAQVVSGTLVEEGTGRPIAGASVLLLDADTVVRGEARTDGSGAWSIPVPGRSGWYRVRVHREGYAAVETAPFQLGAGPVSMRLSTRPEVVTLEGVSSERLAYEGILSRRDRRMGFVIGSDEIASRIARFQPANTAKLVERLLPGIEIDPRTGGLSMPARLGGPGCSPILVVDGRRHDPTLPDRSPRLPPWDVNRLADLWEVRAIEIYQDPWFIPAELKLKFTIQESCGAIFLWTYRAVGWAP